MKAPKKPAEPYAVVVPQPPRETITSYRDTHLFLIPSESRMTVADLAIQIRGQLEAAGFSSDTLITFDGDNDPYEGSYYGTNVSASSPTEVPNKRFASEMESYQLSLPHWLKLRADYERKLVAYRERLALYLIEYKKYVEWKQQNEIERLEARLKELKEKESK
jgi:hypothetical protein